MVVDIPVLNVEKFAKVLKMNTVHWGQGENDAAEYGVGL